MSAIFTKIIAFFISILAFFGINIDNPYDKPVDTVPATAEVIINDDNTVSVNFTENPSTGYSWEYDVMNGSADIKDNKYEAAAVSADVTGAAGIRHYTFYNFADGTTEIVFQYLRTWEDVMPAYKYNVVITKENGEIKSAVLVNLYEQ